MGERAAGLIVTGSLAEELEALRAQVSSLEAETARLAKLLESSLGEAKPSAWRRFAGILGRISHSESDGSAEVAELGPDDVSKVRFGSARLWVGYDQDEVDIFLDRVERHLRERPKPWSPSDHLGADSVADQKFRDRRFRAGYNQKEVDRFLERIVVELRRER